MKTLFTLPFLVLTINSFPQFPTNGLIGYWPFNGNADDESGNGNNGIVHGASLIPDRFNCGSGSAYYFDGIDDYIEIGTLPGLIEHLNSYSISFWYKSGSDISEWSSIIGTINNAAAEMAYEINFHRNGLVFQFGRISFIIRSIEDKYLTFAVYASETFDNQWHHIVFNFENPANNSASVFIDGESREIEYVTTEGPANYGQFENPFTLGATNNRSTINRFYKGCIDDFRIYGLILTEDEIKSLYHIGGWPFINDNFIAYYPFNGNANDESGNGHNGIVNGATLVNDRFGNPNSAYRFDGVNDNILVYNFPMPARELTISLWARTDVEKKHMVFKQLSEDINRVAASIHYYTTWTTTNYPDSINTYWDFGNTSQGRIYACLNQAQLNKWENYIFQVSNENKFMKVFLNGKLVIYNEIAITLKDSIFTLAIGGSEYLDIGLFYQGEVDDIYIYDGILDSIEISQLYYDIKPSMTGEKEVCQGQKNVGYNVHYYGCAKSYTWNYSGTGVTINGSGENALIDFESYATSGDLSVTISDNNEDTSRIYFPLIVNALPIDAGLISGNHEVCAGQTDVSYFVPFIDNATDYIWNYSGTGATITGNASNITVDFADYATSGSLTVGGSDSCGTGTISENFFIEVSTCDTNIDIVSIPNIFTPNGDGINETFVIQGLTENSKLIIFDRAGKKLYETENYQNNWDGRDNNGTSLPSDTYWYVIDIMGYPTEFKGWIYLKR
jgi:gliding motility-associated-like protein